MRAKIFIIVAIFVFSFVFLLMPIASVDAQPKTDSTQSESPLPTPTMIPLSSEAELAISFIAKQHKIPTEELKFGSEQAITFHMLGRNYVYVTIHYDAPGQFQLFSLLVDPATKEVEPDYNAVLAAENAAYRNKYGKFEPVLYERLLTMKESELLPVAVWASHANENRSYEQIVEDVIERFPEAKNAFDEKGSLWSVEDTELSAQIQVYYEQLLAENAALRLQLIVEWLVKQGYKMDKFAELPALSARLPKKLITELGNRDDISMIYLAETEESPALDIAMPTDRTPTVWSRGYKGSGIRIAILEHYNINSTADACLDIYRVRPSTADPTGHKSRVASVAACNDAILRGMAYEAQIADAGEDGTQPDAVTALDWATKPTPTTVAVANVVNWSGNFEEDTVLHLTDRAMDHYIRTRYFTGIIAAGNNGGNVSSPAKGYNVIAVGNVDDKNTVSWSDDEMRSSSSNINPNTSVEKPEVAAPGVLINTVAGEESGTSFAAPQVSGLAALLMQRDPDLILSPSAVKAIIMASAVHNIEGDRRLSSVDGAGSIDAALADQIAQNEGGASACSSSCWWSQGTNITPTWGGNVEYYFNAIRGERIRVAMAWLSNADPPTDTSNDFLLRNFDLNVISPSGTEVKSESPSNNFEIVEFVASATGQYTIRVTRNASGDGGNELGNKLGIAWSKQATYLPDVRRDSTWTSKIYVRNDGAEPRTILVSYFNADGSPPSYPEHSSIVNVQPNEVWSPSLPFANWSGSAIVDGSEDLSVVVEHSTATEKMDYTGIGGYIGGWGASGTTLYSPSLKNDFSGRTGKIYVVNVGSASTNVAVSLRAADNGSGIITCSPANLQAMQPGQQAIFQASNCATSTGIIYGVSLSASQPLVGIAVEANSSDGSLTSATNLMRGGATTSYAPIFKYDYGGNRATLVAQNVGTAATTVTATYYHPTLGPWSESFTLQPLSVHVFSPLNAKDGSGNNMSTNTLASAVVTSSGGQRVAITLYEYKVGGNWRMQHSGSNSGSKLAILPEVYRGYSSGGATWGSAFLVMNTGSSTANITVRYYDAAGNWQSSANQTGTANPNRATTFNISNNSQLPPSFQGSAVVEADQPILVSGNITTTASSGDPSMSFNAINR